MSYRCRYNFNGQWYTKEQLSFLPQFNSKTFAEAMQERDQINSDTGPLTHKLLFSPAEESGVFVKYIQFKERQLTELRRRLQHTERSKKAKGVTKEELVRLNAVERELRKQIFGNEQLGIKGLVDEIGDLKKSADINAVGYYVNKDLQRLNRLVMSDDISDLEEAKKIISFYEAAGTFEFGKENPFFTQEEMFLSDEDGNLTPHYRLSTETMQTFKDWSDKLTEPKNQIGQRYKEVTVNAINNDPAVKATYGDGKKFDFDSIMNTEYGLKDTHWVDMWTMDITQGVFSKNGIIPQVMFSYLTNSLEKKLAWARKVEEKIDKMRPDVEREIAKLDGGKYTLRGGGIIGLKGVSYNLFKEITKEGNETGGLIQRFIKEFFDAQSFMSNRFNNAMNGAKLYEDFNLRSRAFNKAFEEMKAWKRNNTIMFDINKMPEFTSSTPETEAYKQSLVTVLGEKGYAEQVEKQQRLLNKYEAEKQSTIDTLLTLENKNSFDELSDESKNKFTNWENSYSPKVGIEDYNTAKGIFIGDRKVNNFMYYNVTIPRKYIANITAQQDGSYKFEDTTNETGYYSKEFAKIEANPVLSEFYSTIKEIFENVREHMPYEVQEKTAVNTVPALQKSFAEILADKNTGILKTISEAFRHLMERIRLSFGVTEQSIISYANIDTITGKANYKVNDNFLQSNSRAVKERMEIEKAKFLLAYNKTQPTGFKVESLGRFSMLSLSKINPEALSILAEYLNAPISIEEIRAGKIGKIKSVTGDNVEIGKYIRDFSLHSVVQSQSFDLPKLSKYFSNVTMAYAARQEALPILEIMKKYYSDIKEPKTNNTLKNVFNKRAQVNEMLGVRTNAIKQMDDWFERVVLDNYGGKHVGKHGNDTKVIKDDEGNVKTVIPKIGNKIYSTEEKRKIKEIDEIISQADEKTAEKLSKIKSEFGKERTATALFDNFLSWIRTLRLGYNLSSASTNFLEGVTSNMILASMSEYFDPNEIYYGYSIIKHSFLKNITFGIATTGLAKRNRMLMDKFNVIMDSKNELQKSSVKTYTSKFSWLNPHELNQRVEYINQSPVMIAMLRTMKVKDNTGKEARLWDAFNNEGHLKEEFRTEENIQNWENLTGEEYLSFKQKLHKAIVLGHGNYDELRGMMIKNNTAGKALMMFKTWIPMQLYWRFATEQDDIQSGTVGYKGRYWSYNTGTAAVHGAVLGTAMFGIPGFVIGGLTGGIIGKFKGVDTGVGVLKETIEATKALMKKSLGMPVNLLAGRKIIGEGNKAFEEWVGKGDFTAQDAKNLRANMADIAMQLAWLALIFMAKSIFWDDDDNPDDPERITHNILVNKLMALSSQAAMYVNPADLWKNTLGSNALAQYVVDLGKTVTRIDKYIHGEDIIPSGVNAGESGLKIQTHKILMPGIFKDNMFGFDTQAEKVFEESFMHKYFRSDAYNEKESNKRDRAEYRLELQEGLKLEDFGGDQKELDKEIRRRVDERFPTPTKLKKLNLTREEYDDILNSQK